MTAVETSKKSEVVAQFARAANDTGSPEVQVALLTTRINELTVHFKAHTKRSPQPPRFAAHGEPSS